MASKLSPLFVSLSLSLRHLFPLAVECCLILHRSHKRPLQFPEHAADALRLILNSGSTTCNKKRLGVQMWECVEHMLLHSHLCGTGF